VLDEPIEAKSDRIGEEQGPYDIGKIDFERLKQEFERSPAMRTTVQSLKTAIEQRLHKEDAHRILFRFPLRISL
jgi:type I restriction enzyme, R subunit